MLENLVIKEENHI